MQPGVEMEPMVLVVDDEASVRTLISNSLRDHGYRTTEASDGVAALRLAKELKPDAVVLDIELPALDGTTVLQALRSDPETGTVPIIGMSGYDIDPADERSFTCFLQKPFSPSDVVFVLAQVAPTDSRS
jgi:CheY-like chemotaxis protein